MFHGKTYIFINYTPIKQNIRKLMKALVKIPNQTKKTEGSLNLGELSALFSKLMDIL